MHVIVEQFHQVLIFPLVGDHAVKLSPQWHAEIVIQIRRKLEEIDACDLVMSVVEVELACGLFEFDMNGFEFKFGPQFMRRWPTG